MVRENCSYPYEGKANSIQLKELDESDCWMGFFQPFAHDIVNDSLQKEEGIVIQLVLQPFAHDCKMKKDCGRPCCVDISDIVAFDTDTQFTQLRDMEDLDG